MSLVSHQIISTPRTLLSQWQKHVLIRCCVAGGTDSFQMSTGKQNPDFSDGTLVVCLTLSFCQREDFWGTEKAKADPLCFKGCVLMSDNHEWIRQCNTGISQSVINTKKKNAAIDYSQNIFSKNFEEVVARDKGRGRENYVTSMSEW